MNPDEHLNAEPEIPKDVKQLMEMGFEKEP